MLAFARIWKGWYATVSSPMSSPGLVWAGRESELDVDARNVARLQKDALGLELVERVQGFELLGASGKRCAERRSIAAHVNVDQVAGDHLQPQMAAFDALGGIWTAAI